MNKIIPLFQSGKTRFENEQFASHIYETFTKHFYKRYTYQGQFAPMIGRNNPFVEASQLIGGDVCGISAATMETVVFEEKADSYKPINCFLELYSNTTTVPPIDSWLKTSKATHLLYSFYWLPKEINAPILDSFLWKMRLIQSWFWKREVRKAFGEPIIQKDTPNQTSGYPVRLFKIIQEVPTKRYLIMPPMDNKDAIIESVDPAASLDEIKSIALALYSSHKSTIDQARGGIA
jgi:hypothetical protein